MAHLDCGLGSGKRLVGVEYVGEFVFLIVLVCIALGDQRQEVLIVILLLRHSTGLLLRLIILQEHSHLLRVNQA